MAAPDAAPPPSPRQLRVAAPPTDGAPTRTWRGDQDRARACARRIVACWDNDWRPQWRVDIITGDRDLFQLVDDFRHVRVIYTGRGMSRLEALTHASLTEKTGVTPAHR